MRLGRIVKVSGTKAVARFFERLPPYLMDGDNLMRAPRLHSYVTTRVGLETIICQIVGEFETEYDGAAQSGVAQELDNFDAMPREDSFMVELEVRGSISDGVFQSGLRSLPYVGAVVETISSADLKAITATDFNHLSPPPSIGTNLFDETQRAYISPDRIFPSHLGVYGNTGSGKSNTLANLLRLFSNKVGDNGQIARVVVLDLNNEYGDTAIVAEETKSIFGKQNRIPLCFAKLSDDQWGTLLAATSKTQLPVVRRALKKWRNFLGEINRESMQKYLNEWLIHVLGDAKRDVFEELRYYVLQYLGDDLFQPYGDSYLWDSVRWRTGDSQKFWLPAGWIEGKPATWINAADEVPIELFIPPLDGMSDLQCFLLFLIFEVAQTSEYGNFEYVRYLIPRAHDLIVDLEEIFEPVSRDDGEWMLTSVINVVQLGEVGESVRERVASLIARRLFDSARTHKTKNGGKVQELTILAIDEAHNLLAWDSNQENSVRRSTLDVYEQLVKEGRKFGIFLWIASQRPKDISYTVSSQLHNYFIHRLVNPQDIDMVSRAVSFIGSGGIDMLPNLGQGECIESGTAFPTPHFIYINPLEKEYRPLSPDISLDYLLENLPLEQDSGENSSSVEVSPF